MAADPNSTSAKIAAHVHSEPARDRRLRSVTAGQHRRDELRAALVAHGLQADRVDESALLRQMQLVPDGADPAASRRSWATSSPCCSRRASQTALPRPSPR